MPLTHIPSRLEVEFFRILRCGLWGWCGSSLAEDQRGQVPLGVSHCTFFSPWVPGRSSLRKPAMTRFRCALSPQPSMQPYRTLLEFPSWIVSPGLSTFVFPTQLLKLLLPLQFHTQNWIAKSRLTSLEIIWTDGEVLFESHVGTSMEEHTWGCLGLQQWLWETGELHRAHSGTAWTSLLPTKARWKLMLRYLPAAEYKKSGTVPALTGIHSNSPPYAPGLGSLWVLQCLSDLAPSCYHTTETFYFSWQFYITSRL